MILNTGSRTDIPAFYSAWFLNRIREGWVLARNPYRPDELTRYFLGPSVVDVLVFCTKDPGPMLPHLHELSSFRQFWGVTITPYGEEIERAVPPAREVVRSVKELSSVLGKDAVAWRYDPVIIHGRYSVSFHEYAFEVLARSLSGYVSFVVVSFLDLYRKTLRNFPEGREVSAEEQAYLTGRFVKIAGCYGLGVHLCAEDPGLGCYGADVSGCLTKAVLERAHGIKLDIPKTLKAARSSCSCLLGSDIGEYNTCMHGCRYCYANQDMKLVEENWKRHDPSSPLLTGWPGPDDRIRKARQESYLSHQLELF